MLLRAGRAGRPCFQGNRCHQPGAGRVQIDGPRARQNVSHKKVVITGGDSGIGRAVAIAYAREGADVLISYLDEHDDALETERLVTEAGRKAVLLPGFKSIDDISDEEWELTW